MSVWLVIMSSRTVSLHPTTCSLQQTCLHSNLCLDDECSDTEPRRTSSHDFLLGISHQQKSAVLLTHRPTSPLTCSKLRLAICRRAGTRKQIGACCLIWYTNKKAYLCEPAQVAQHCQYGFACFVQLESAASLQITVYKPKLATNTFLALHCRQGK